MRLSFSAGGVLLACSVGCAMEVGEPVDPLGTESFDLHAERITVATYNIRWGGQTEERLARIADMIYAQSVDVVGLQEVNGFIDDGPAWQSWWRNRFNTASRLQELLRARGVEFPYVSRVEGGEGGGRDVQVLSRYPLEDYEHITFGGCASAQTMVIALPTGSRFRLFNTHVCHPVWCDGTEQDRSLDLYHRILEYDDHPRIALGDFNFPRDWQCFQRMLGELVSACRPGLNQSCRDTLNRPQPDPEIAVDHVFVERESSWRVIESFVDHGAETSDHYPVVARLVNGLSDNLCRPRDTDKPDLRSGSLTAAWLAPIYSASGVVEGKRQVLFLGDEVWTRDFLFGEPRWSSWIHVPVRENWDGGGPDPSNVLAGWFAPIYDAGGRAIGKRQVFFAGTSMWVRQRGMSDARWGSWEQRDAQRYLGADGPDALRIQAGWLAPMYDFDNGTLLGTRQVLFVEGDQMWARDRYFGDSAWRRWSHRSTQVYFGAEGPDARGLEAAWVAPIDHPWDGRVLGKRQVLFADGDMWSRNRYFGQAAWTPWHNHGTAPLGDSGPPAVCTQP